MGTPTVGPVWQLRLEDVETTIHDTRRRRPFIAGSLWRLIKGRVEGEVRGFINWGSIAIWWRRC